MYRELLKKVFGTVFLVVFFMKMMIPAIPLFYALKNGGTLPAVVLQLEMEEEKDQLPEKQKEAFFKEYCTDFLTYTFEAPLNYVNGNAPVATLLLHIQSFYPPVPTPPPNA